MQAARGRRKRRAPAIPYGNHTARADAYVNPAGNQTARASDCAATSTPTPATVRQPQPSASATAMPTAALADEPLPSLQVQRAFPNLAFRRLTNLAQPQDAPDRIFVTEQAGLVRAFPNDSQATEAGVFLDIRDRVSEAGNEEGLLGLAFDPDYAANGHFYVYYSADSPRRSVVSRFTVLPDSLTAADPDSELVIMEIPQPYSNHNGGQLAFGPDGYLYVGLGDGGSRGDPMGNGQDLGTLLGTILRVDVAGASVDGGYAVPSDNPFVGVQGARRRYGPTGCATPGDSPLTGRPARSGWATWGKTGGRR